MCCRTTAFLTIYAFWIIILPSLGVWGHGLRCAVFIGFGDLGIGIKD